MLPIRKQLQRGINPSGSNILPESPSDSESSQMRLPQAPRDAQRLPETPINSNGLAEAPRRSQMLLDTPRHS